MEEVVTDKLPVFIGHEYVRRAGASCKGNHALGYHTYPVPEGSVLKDTVSLAYDDFLQLKGRKNRQLIDIYKCGSTEPLPEDEAGEKENEDSGGGSADGIPGEWLGSDMDDIRDE